MVKLFLNDIYIMNKSSNSMDEYSRELDSIETEISYSPSSEMPINGSKISKNKKNFHTPQKGGGFFDSLFSQVVGKGSDESTGFSTTLPGSYKESAAQLKERGTEITKLIMDAIETGNNDAADFLMSRRFVPDLTYVNAQKENLLHILVKAKDQTKNAQNVLAQLVSNKANKDALNAQDIDGNTPLHVAVKKGYNAVAELIARAGAVRSANKQDKIVMTDFDTTQDFSRQMRDDRADKAAIIESDSSGRPIVIDVSSSDPQRTSRQTDSRLSSIFSKPTQYSDKARSESQNIADIVRAFMTKSSTESDSRDITRTDMPSAAQVQESLKQRNPFDRLRPSFQSTATIPKVTVVNVPVSLNKDTSDERALTKLLEKGANTDTDTFSLEMAKQLSGQDNPLQKGGKRNAKKTKKITTKNNRIVGTRHMISFSEVENTNDYSYDYNNDRNNNFRFSDMSGGMSEDEMRNISRASNNQKNKFHEEAVEKILALLPTKDNMTAKAVKAIIYDEIKQSNQNLSGLDRAAELLKAVTKKKVEEALKQKSLIKEIIDHLEAKNKEFEASKGKSFDKPKDSEEPKKESKKEAKKSTKRATKKNATKKNSKKKENGKQRSIDDIEFESSVSDSSYSDSSDSNKSDSESD
jgi:hypothetical protein